MTANRRRDPFRPLDLLGVVWSSAAAMSPLFTTVRRLVRGRRITVRLDRGDLAMTVTAFDSRLDMRRLAVGQLDDVRLAANDILWGRNKFTHATAVLRNVHLRQGVPPMLVAAPVELSLDIPGATLDELFLTAGNRFFGEVDADGVARVFWARRPGWGNVEVVTELDGAALFVRPRAVSVARRRWTLPIGTPRYRIQLPELPHGLQLTDVRFEPDLLRLTGIVPEWRLEFSRRRVEVLLHQLSTTGLVNLTRSTLRSVR